jgi:preprotein translocase subunit YajC
LQATITGITDDTVDLEIAPGVVTTWMKPAIRYRIEPETSDAEAADVEERREQDAVEQDTPDRERLTND